MCPLGIYAENFSLPWMVVYHSVLVSESHILPQLVKGSVGFLSNDIDNVGHDNAIIVTSHLVVLTLYAAWHITPVVIPYWSGSDPLYAAINNVLRSDGAHWQTRDRVAGLGWRLGLQKACFIWGILWKIHMVKLAGGMNWFHQSLHLNSINLFWKNAIF